MKKYFTCYIESRGDQWEAACVDFDISVVGRSLDDAKSRLEIAVHGYVEDAMREMEPARTQLLNRRSPLSVRVGWRLRMLVSQLGNGVDAPSFEGRYALPCPA